MIPDDALQPDGTLMLDEDDADGFHRSLDWSPEHDKPYLEGFWTVEELEAIVRHVRREQERRKAA